jgi:hypothetical protein
MNYFCFANHKAIDLTTGAIVELADDPERVHCGYDLPERNEDEVNNAQFLMMSFFGHDHYDTAMNAVSSQLSSEPSKRLFIHLGDGCSGKSSLHSVVRSVFGNYFAMNGDVTPHTRYHRMCDYDGETPLNAPAHVECTVLPELPVDTEVVVVNYPYRFVNDVKDVNDRLRRNPPLPTYRNGLLWLLVDHLLGR